MGPDGADNLRMRCRTDVVPSLNGALADVLHGSLGFSAPRRGHQPLSPAGLVRLRRRVQEVQYLPCRVAETEPCCLLNSLDSHL
jgi:hypothetical protein